MIASTINPFAVCHLNSNLYDADGQCKIDAMQLETTCHTHTVVVGAGLTGISAAWHLAQAGVPVVVLEAREVGFGASGRNGGQLNAGLKNSHAQTLQRFGAVHGERFWALAHSAPTELVRLIQTLAIDCELSLGGTLKASRLLQLTPTAPAAGADASEWCDAERMYALTGSRYYAEGEFDPKGATLQPKRLILEWAKRCVRQGVQIFANTPALRIIRAPGCYRVETPHGSVIADNLVLATDGYSDHLWPKLKQSIIPLYSCMVASEPLPAALSAEILPKRPAVYETQRVTVYYRKDAAGRLLLGGRGPQRELRSPADVRPIIQHALKLWPQLHEVRMTHAWNGQFALTTDFYPRLHRPAPRVWIGLGYSGRGVAMAVAMGRQIANSVQGMPDADLMVPITAIKPLRGHRYWPWGVWFNTHRYALQDAWDRRRYRRR
jgi:glycine/D-amino acid oxidase-like deaminating enzyme